VSLVCSAWGVYPYGEKINIKWPLIQELFSNTPLGWEHVSLFLLDMLDPSRTKIMSVPTSWAQRNPDLPIQPVHRTRATLTDAQKATRKISKALNHQKNADLAADLTQYTTECEEQVAKLAEKHSCKPERITRLLNTSSTFKKHRRPNLHNAILHQKAVDENQGEFTQQEETT
jgi:hypothetical protein